MFHVAIRERKIATSVVAAGRQVPPDVPVFKSGRVAELRIYNGIGVFINKNEGAAGPRCFDGIQGGPHGNFERQFLRLRGTVRPAVHGLAHIIAPPARLREQLAIRRLQRGHVGRAMINPQLGIEGEQRAVDDVGGVDFCLGIQIRQPGDAAARVSDRGICPRFDKRNRIVWRQVVVVVPDVEMPANLKLALIVQAFDIDGGLPGLAQNGKNDGRENGDDGNDNKQLDERKTRAPGASFPAALMETAHFHAIIVSYGLVFVFRFYLKLDVFQAKKVPDLWVQVKKYPAWFILP
jgi:hypothetical protein